MSYILRNGLSCCEVDSHLVFLDLNTDRYFRLSSADEPAMRCFLAQQQVSNEQARRLVRAGILVENAGEVHRTTAPAVPPPSHSAIEQSDGDMTGRAGVVAILEVMTLLWGTRRELRSRPLADIVEAAARRWSKANPENSCMPVQSDDRLLRAVAAFGRARRYVPIEPNCLPDSLSMVRFLSRRGLSARVVFGVTLNPFAAHCWVQAGETVLNDTLSNVQSHTSIKVI